MSSDLKDKAITGIVWSSIERFGSDFIRFIFFVILARLLTPDDFGLIGMLTVFIVVSNIFLQGGFGSALIQKKKILTRLVYQKQFYN